MLVKLFLLAKNVKEYIFQNYLTSSKASVIFLKLFIRSRKISLNTKKKILDLD